MKNIEPFTLHHLRKSLIFFILLLFIQFSLGRDTLSAGQTLAGDELLVSSDETFALGFFSSPGMSKNRYLGIWYYKVSEKRVVWVANRGNPVNDTSGVLSFQKSKNLVIYGHNLKTPIWSTSFSGRGKNYSAQILDIGNFVVFEENKKRVIAWQSFDHPTDTWLPEMKLGVNRKTGFRWSLTSWKSVDDPGAGEYSFRMDDVIHEFSELSLYKGPDRRWRTGPLNRGAQPIADMSLDATLNFTNVGNGDEVYVMTGVHNPTDYSIITVSQDGYIIRMTSFPGTTRWKAVSKAPNVLCDYYSKCGPNGKCNAPSTTTVLVSDCLCLPGSEPKSPRDWNSRNVSGGCVRKRDRNDCRNRDGFTKLSVTKMPDTATARSDRILGGLKECEEKCLSDCNCTAHANVPQMGSACVMWFGDLMDTNQLGSGGLDLFVRLDTAQDRKKQHYSFPNHKRKVAAVVTSVGVVAAFIAIFILCWLTHKRKGLRSREEHVLYGANISAPSQPSSSELFDERQTSAELPFFDLKSLAEATNNFSTENKLGEDGFGSVYKGTLKNRKEIAVKRLSYTSRQGVEEFKNEATLIAKLQHRNLVRILGYCAQDKEKMLIYEFLPNKSLNSLIFDKAERSRLDWAQCFSIIKGITRGMIYLHQDSRLKVIHRDLKASNVLLDAKMIPKISNFGMARIFSGDEDEANTNRIVGTSGYMSPEYAMEGLYSVKSDVFSLGVLLLEIISGRKNNNYYYEEKYMNLIGHVWHLWREERALEIVDSSLGDYYSSKEVLRCIHVGLLSVRELPDLRPTMCEIAFMLSDEIDLPPPRHPAFVVKNLSSQYTSSTSVGSLSTDQYTSSSSVGSL